MTIDASAPIFMTSHPAFAKNPAAQPAPMQSCYCPNCEALSKELAALKAQPRQEPVAWLHKMDNTEGLKANGKGIISITQKRKHPFGKPGVDFSKSYPVTSTPLYAAPPAAQPEYRAVKTYHDNKPWYVAQPEQEKCQVCGEGEATLMVIRECNKCGSEYAGKAEFDLAKAQRTWVGLTEVELDAIYAGNEGTRTRRQIYQAIEAKLKEKNT